MAPDTGPGNVFSFIDKALADTYEWSYNHIKYKDVVYEYEELNIAVPGNLERVAF